MDLLTRTWRDLRRLLATDAWFTLGVALTVLLVELIGRRQAFTDVHDMCALAVLGGVGWLVLKKHQVTPLPWLTALYGQWQRLGGFLSQHYAIEIGIDLRGTPPLPRALPRALVTAMGLLLVEVLVLFLFADYVPLALRGLAIRIWYTGYLIVLALLWLALLSATALALYHPVALIHDAFVTRQDGHGRRLQRFEGPALVGYFSLLLLAALILPPWIPLLVSLAALAVNLATITLPSNPNVQFLWRYRSGEGTIRSIPWGLWVTFSSTFLTLAALDLVLSSAGSTVLGDRSPFLEPVAAASPEMAIVGLSSAAEVMPITTSLGLTLAWLAPSGLVLFMLQIVLNRTRDPARPCWPVLHVQGNLPLSQGRCLRAYLATRGWNLRMGRAQPTTLDTCVRLVDRPVPLSDEGANWPLPVTLEALQTEEVFQRISRRYEIQMRRRLLAGLERLFKMAAARTFRRGSGLWVAPHLWFIPGLSRDTPEEELDLERSTLFSSIVGVPYHRILPRCVRHHAYRVLQAAQIDLIFVEDGVSFKRFSRVLRVLFEVYDMHAGRRRAEEIHFQGLPGTRVVIHDFQLDEPYRSHVYPEPEFENLARARILHVFRDRGEQEDRLEDPLDFTRLPAPSAAF